MGAMMSEDRFGLVNFTFDPASVAANTSVEQTVTVPGLKLGDYIAEVAKPTLTAGLSIAGTRVSAANTLAITFVNSTAAPIDAASETYQAFWVRFEHQSATSANA